MRFLNRVFAFISAKEFTKVFIYCFTPKSQIWTVASLTYKQQKDVCQFSIAKIFSPRAIFIRSLHIFLILFRKCFLLFHCNWPGRNADRFLRLWVRKLGNKLNVGEKKMCFDLELSKGWFGCSHLKVNSRLRTVWYRGLGMCGLIRTRYIASTLDTSSLPCTQLKNDNEPVWIEPLSFCL